jgi:uncharacterized membrane protein
MVVVAFDQKDRAAEVLSELRRQARRSEIQVIRMDSISRDEQGNVLLAATTRPAGGGIGGAAFGTVMGAMVGFLSLGPAGAVLGGAAGAVTGRAATGGERMGFDRETSKQIEESVPAGYSAVLAVIETQNADAFLEHIQQFGGKVYRQSLNESLASQIRRDLETEDPPASE